jgi:hypothetical protein
MRQTIKVGFDQSNMPCTYIKDGEVMGLEARYAIQVLKLTGLEYQLIPLNWTEMFPCLLDGVVDVIFSSISMTSARRDSLIGTVPYFNTPETMVRFKKGANHVQTYGALTGTNHERYLIDNFGDCVLRSFSSYSDLVKEMEQRSLDGCLVDWFHGDEMVTMLNQAGVQFSHEGVVEPDWFGHGSSMLACPGNELIVAALDSAINVLGPLEASLTNSSIRAFDFHGKLYEF